MDYAQKSPRALLQIEGEMGCVDVRCFSGELGPLGAVEIHEQI